MNRAIFLATLRQRARSPVRIAILFFMLVLPLLFVATGMIRTLQGLGDAFTLVLVLGAGVIGQDLASGVLQLTFARPVRRSEYVFSKWAAIALPAAVLALSQLALGALILSSRGHAVAWRALELKALESALGAAGSAAVLVLFSSLLSGFGDLGLFLLIGFGGSMVEFAGQVQHLPLIARLGSELSAFAVPRVGLTAPWYSLAAYGSNLVLSLALAIVVLNRRELSYATG